MFALSPSLTFVPGAIVCARRAKCIGALGSFNKLYLKIPSIEFMTISQWTRWHYLLISGALQQRPLGDFKFTTIYYVGLGTKDGGEVFQRKYFDLKTFHGNLRSCRSENFLELT